MRRQSGFALVESILVSLVLLMPLVWGLTVLSQLHQAALASNAAAREAGTDAAGSTSATSAGAVVDAAVRSAFADEGLDPTQAKVAVSIPSGFARGGTVVVHIAYPVAAFQAPFLGKVSTPVIWVRATHVAQIDPYRSR
jgi:hypothetical protein